MNRKIRIKFNWEIGGWEDNKTVVPVITSFFIGDYSGYLKESVKYFFGEKKIQLNFNYKNYLYNVLFDGGYDSYFLIIPPLKKCIEEVEKIKSGVSENFFLEMGEGFGAEIRKEAVLLYFLYDYEKYGDYDIIPFECFYETLFGWINFLETQPDLNKEIVTEYDIDILNWSVPNILDKYFENLFSIY